MKKYGEGYYQKSTLFLYPLVGLGRDTVFKPSNTYLYFNGEESIENYELLVLFKDSGPLFNVFEESNLKSNDKLTTCYEVEDGKMYIFDLISDAWDVAHFIYGDYPMMSDKSKSKILGFHNISRNGNPSPDKIAEIGLNPEKYYKSYADQLGMKVSDIKNNTKKKLIHVFDKDLETYKGQVIKNTNCIPERGPAFINVKGKIL